MSKDITKEKKPFNKKKLKYGAVATAITVFVIAIVVFINLIAGILTERKGLKLDLTAQNFYEISQESIDYIKNLDTDVEIAVMTKKEDIMNSSMGKIIVESLAKYEQNSEHITVEYYDIEKSPDIVNKYAASYNGEINENSLIIASGDRVKAADIRFDLFSIDTSAYYQTGMYSYTGYIGESVITPAIMSVTDANPKRVAFASFYNNQRIYSSALDNTLNSMMQLLYKSGYEVTAIDFLAQELSPEEYDIVVLPAPMNDLTEDGIAKLENFLYNNGNLDTHMIYISDVTQRKTPNIDAFLEVWGIRVGDGQVIESSSDKRQQVNIDRSGTGYSKTIEAPIVSISDSTYSEGLSNTKLPVVMPGSRNIEVLFDANVDRTATALLTTSDTAVLYPLNLEETQEISLGETAEATEETEAPTEFNLDSAERTQQVVAALASKVNVDSNDVTHTNNLLVLGSMSFTDANIVNVSTYNNAEFLISTVNKICGKENNIIIFEEKNFDAKMLNITASQVSAVKWVVMAVIPVIIAICGVVVFIRRKNR